jgi:hypothetical protein
VASVPRVDSRGDRGDWDPEVKDGPDAPHRIDAFAAVAEDYCAWAEQNGDAADPDADLDADPDADATAARTLLAELFRRAIDLPSPDAGDDADAPEIPPDEYQRVYQRFGGLPFNYYSECFNPLTVPAEEPVTADLADDLADIWRDVKAGLLLYRGGNRNAAAWIWRFHFDVHWGHHATAAIYALQSWFSAQLGKS